MQVIAKIFGKYMVLNHKWLALKIIKGIASQMLRVQAKIHWGKSWVSVSISSEEGENFSKMTFSFDLWPSNLSPYFFQLSFFVKWVAKLVI